jgi:hypothetical protein
MDWSAEVEGAPVLRLFLGRPRPFRERLSRLNVGSSPSPELQFGDRPRRGHRTWRDVAPPNSRSNAKSGADVVRAGRPNYVDAAHVRVPKEKVSSVAYGFNLPRISQMSRSVMSDTTSLATGV